MRKPLSTATKYKIKLFTVYICAIIFCIFWLAAEIEITRRVKRDRIFSEECLGAAKQALDDYTSLGDEKYLENCASRLLDLYSVAKLNSERGSVLSAMRRGYPKFTQEQICDLGTVAAIMLYSPEDFRRYVDEIVFAVELLSGDISEKSRKIDPRAAEIFEKIKNEISTTY